MPQSIDARYAGGIKGIRLMKLRPTLPGDLFGGVTAAIIMLPMALAFGVASGLGPAAGLYGAVAVGLFAAVFGGTPSQISGPTGPMTVAMATVVALYADSLPVAFTIVMLAGLLQMALGFLRIGSFMSYTPYSVISGFMTGIGMIIIVLQVLPLVGASPAAGGPLDQIRAWPEAIANGSLEDLAVGLIALAVCVFWPRRIRTYFPAPLAALALGTLASLFIFTQAHTIGAIPVGFPALYRPHIEWSTLIALLEPALVIALLGSIDSLLTSLVADSQTRTHHNPNRELLGQGLGNLVAGVVGGLPGAGATTGTVSSIRAGGRSPIAGALAAMLLLTLVLGFGWIAEPIPTAVLAGILLKIGWDIIDWRFVVRLRAIRSQYVFTMLLTFSITVFVDLITAVALGLIAAGILRARDLATSEMDHVQSLPLLDAAFIPNLEDLDPKHLPVGLVTLHGAFTIGSAHDFSRAVTADIEDHDVVIIDFSLTTDVDDSAALAMEELIETALDHDTDCIVVGLTGEVAEVLHSLAVLRHVSSDHFVDDVDSAKALAGSLLEARRGRLAADNLAG